MASSVVGAELPFAIPPEFLAELPTPCLIVDVAAAERNIQRAAAYFSGRPAKLRPHFKAHKCTELTRRQLAAGACVGVTCATAWEAEVLARAGFEDILIANQVLDRCGLDRLGRAAQRARVTVAVDHPRQVELLGEAARRQGVTLGVLIEVEVGGKRCGVDSADPLLVVLAQQVRASGGLWMRGLLGYEGGAVLKESRAERQAAVEVAADTLRRARGHLQRAGFTCEIVSGGGTGTFDLAAETGVLTEVEAGSYVLMDARYGAVEGLPFEHALYCCATVLSCPRPGAAVLNAGLKALTVEYGLPHPVQPGLEVLGLADEHARISVADGARAEVGEPLLLIPAHIDPAINLHDVLFAWRGEEHGFAQWRVDGRRRLTE